MTQLQLSARACHRILKLARTITDLAGSEHMSGAPGRGAAGVEEIITGLAMETGP